MSARLRSNVAPPPTVTVDINDAQPAAPISVAPHVLEQLDPARNTDANTGLNFQLEVVPDFRFPLLSWLFTLSRHVPNSAYVTSPYASPASAIGYTIIMYVALLFHTDAAHLIATSAAAAAIMNDARYARFFDMLLDLPVPDFAHNEFSSLQAFLPDDIPALAVLSSLACADYFHDFGRHFSANIFFLAHNLLASLPANTPTGNLRFMFYSTTVNTVNIGNNNNVNITPAQLFGAIAGDNTVHNWLNERLSAMVNSMAIRAVNQNNIVAQVQYPVSALADATNYNPYLFLTALDHATIHSTTSAVQNLSAWIKSTFPASRTLRHYLQPGSFETINYLYTDIALPTWNTNTVTATGPSMPIQTISDTALAAAYGFLAIPAPPTAEQVNGTTVFNLNITRAAATPTAHPMYQVLDQGRAGQPTPRVNPISYVAYNTQEHLLPRTYIFAPYVTNTGALGSVILSGKWIESGDISGIKTTVPSPSTGLLYENAQFHDGAIRLSRTRSALFHNGTLVHMETRPRRFSTNATIAFFRGMSSGLRLASSFAGPIRAATSRPSNQARTAPGALLAVDSFDTVAATNVFGRDLDTDLQLHESTEFNVWSSFRFRHHRHNESVIYVFPTLRHIFGARAQSFGTVHPALRLPL